MRETLTRRLKELYSDDPSFSEKPDLIMVDGEARGSFQRFTT